MNSNGDTTPLSSQLKRISGTSKTLQRLKNRENKKIRKNKRRAKIFGFANKKGDDSRTQINRAKNTKRQSCGRRDRFEQHFKIRRALRRSQRLRERDQMVQNEMFHTKLLEIPVGGNPGTVEETDCILIEKVAEVILVDDDDDKSKILTDANKTQENIQETFTSSGILSYINPTGSNISDCVCIDSTVKSEATIKDGVPNDSNNIREEPTATLDKSVRKEESLEVLSLCSDSSSEETSDYDSSESDSSDGGSSEGNGSSSEKDKNKEKEAPLFFEDNQGGRMALPGRSDAPIYTIPTDKSDIFNLTQPSDDVVFVSSTPLDSKRRKKQHKRKRDDSVIFVSEEPAAQIKNWDYISLNTDDDANGKLPLRLRELKANNYPPSKKKRKNQGVVVTPKNIKAVGNADLFTASEKKKIAIYNSNTYNPNQVDLPKGKRMVIIDGSNVAYGHAYQNQFSVKGLKIAIEYFEKIGHEVKAVVPQKRRQKTFSSDPELLDRLHKEGKVIFTPCKHLPGMSSSSYDDRFILQLAIEFDAAIVSNDNYRDLLHENPAFKKIIESRVIGYTWCNDLFMLPKDPYGRNGPSLSVILNRV